MNERQVGNYKISVDRFGTRVFVEKASADCLFRGTFFSVLWWRTLTETVETAVRWAIKRTIKDQKIKSERELATEYLDILIDTEKINDILIDTEKING